jgi:predicted metalloprotease with PDZ domain
MSRPTLASLALLALLTSTVTSAAPEPIDYRIAPVLKDGALQALTVEVRLQGDADGETVIGLPDEWAGSKELWRNLEGFEVEGATLTAPAPNLRRLQHAPGAALVLRYRVTTAYAGEPGFEYEKARPLVQGGWFFFHGEGVFAAPDGRIDSPARFTWVGFPADWKIASDLDHLARRAGTVSDIVESVAIGAPDLVVVTRPRDGAPLRVAVRGAWPFSAETFADSVIRIVEAADALWDDAPRPYLIPLAPLGGGTQGHSYHGTGRGDAFSVAATSTFELAGATQFLAHEYQHTWFPTAFGQHMPKPEARGYWFSEGFTNYFAARVLLEAGLWTPTEFAADLDATLLRVATSSARTATVDDIVARFWTDQEVQKVPYDRGHLLGHVLDARIRAATRGKQDLYSVLLALKRRAPQEPAALEFARVVKDLTRRDLMTALKPLVDGGVPLRLPPDRFGACVTLTTNTQPEFHRGFDLAATQASGNRLVGVDPALPAYQAGMRDGMQVVRREGGVTGDSSVELKYHVLDGETPRVFTYRPEGHAILTLQRARVASDAPADCARRLTGVH